MKNNISSSSKNSRHQNKRTAMLNGKYNCSRKIFVKKKMDQLQEQQLLFFFVYYQVIERRNWDKFKSNSRYNAILYFYWNPWCSLINLLQTSYYYYSWSCPRWFFSTYLTKKSDRRTVINSSIKPRKFYIFNSYYYSYLKKYFNFNANSVFLEYGLLDLNFGGLLLAKASPLIKKLTRIIGRYYSAINMDHNNYGSSRIFKDFFKKKKGLLLQEEVLQNDLLDNIHYYYYIGNLLFPIWLVTRKPKFILQNLSSDSLLMIDLYTDNLLDQRLKNEFSLSTLLFTKRKKNEININGNNIDRQKYENIDICVRKTLIGTKIDKDLQKKKMVLFCQNPERALGELVPLSDHLKKGFIFQNFHIKYVRKKLFLLLSDLSIRFHFAQIKQILKNKNHFSVPILIIKLNQQIRFWSYFYGFLTFCFLPKNVTGNNICQSITKRKINVDSNRTATIFYKDDTSELSIRLAVNNSTITSDAIVDHFPIDYRNILHKMNRSLYQLLWQWAKKRHNNQSNQLIFSMYWTFNKQTCEWNFHTFDLKRKYFLMKYNIFTRPTLQACLLENDLL